jgi:hypothetical protein
MVTLRIGWLGGLSAGRGPCPGRDAVADGDFLGADQDVFDEEPQYALALFGCAVPALHRSWARKPSRSSASFR